MLGPKAKAAVPVASGSGVRDPEEGTRFVTVNSSHRQLRSLVENVQGNGTGMAGAGLARPLPEKQSDSLL
jgi:hypothetical protein